MTTTDLYYDGQNVIEERSGWTTRTQYVYAPNGQVILRDRDADGNAATGELGKTKSGLDERIYALQDGRGNMVAITNATGQVIERYVYDQAGRPTALQGNWLSWTGMTNPSVTATTHYGWRYFWQGERWTQVFAQNGDAGRPWGLYQQNGSWYDADNARMIQPDAGMIAEGRNAYTPSEGEGALAGSYGWWLGMTRWVGVGSLIAAAGIACPPLGIAMLGFGLGYIPTSRAMEGQIAGQVIGGTLGDLTGVNAVIHGWNTPGFAGGAEFGGGIVQLGLMGYGAYEFARSPMGVALGRYAIERMTPSNNSGGSSSLAYSGVPLPEYTGPSLRSMMNPFSRVSIPESYARGDLTPTDIAQRLPVWSKGDPAHAAAIVNDRVYLLRSSGPGGRPQYATNLVPDSVTELGLGFTPRNVGHVELQASALLRGLEA